MLHFFKTPRWHFKRYQPCLLCMSPTKTAFCDPCLNDLMGLATDALHHCPCCAVWSPAGAICGQCQKMPLGLTACWASFAYQYPLNHLLQQWKYASRTEISKGLSQLMISTPPPWSLSSIDSIIAMPLSLQKTLSRGFHQTHFLAASLAKHYAIPLLPEALIFRRHNRPQSGLNRRERQKNIRHEFNVLHSLQGQNVLIIDDVLTTGATMKALTKSLKKAGVNHCHAWVFARAQW